MSRRNRPPQSLGVIVPGGSSGRNPTGADPLRFPESGLSCRCATRPPSGTSPRPLHGSAPVGLRPNDSEDVTPLRISGSTPRLFSGVPAPHKCPPRASRPSRIALFSRPGLINSIPRRRNSPHPETPAILRVSGRCCRSAARARPSRAMRNRLSEAGTVAGRSPPPSTGHAASPPLRSGPAGDRCARPAGGRAYRQCRPTPRNRP